MSSILNSISSGDLQVQEVPRDTPKKVDSIIELLNSEVEFEVQHKCEHTEQKPEFVLEEFVEETPKVEISVEDILDNLDLELETCPNLNNNLGNVNTGFGNNNDAYYETPCCKPKLQTPLYKDNFLSEFETEEEKAAARKSLGITNVEDLLEKAMVVSSLGIPSKEIINNASIQHLRKDNKLFLPVTSFNAVIDQEGVSLTSRFENITKVIQDHRNLLDTINNPSQNKSITTLGDVRKFLQGFNNGDNLHNTINTINKEMLRFEITGQVL